MNLRNLRNGSVKSSKYLLEPSSTPSTVPGTRDGGIQGVLQTDRYVKLLFQNAAIMAETEIFPGYPGASTQPGNKFLENSYGK